MEAQEVEAGKRAVNEVDRAVEVPEELKEAFAKISEYYSGFQPILLTDKRFKMVVYVCGDMTT